MKNKRVLAVFVATAVALATFGLLFVMGTLNPRSFAIGCMLVMAASTIIGTFLLIRSNVTLDNPSAAASSVQKSNRKKYLQAAAFVLYLGGSLWITRDGPWVPRLIGASMLTLFAIGTILKKPR